MGLSRTGSSVCNLPSVSVLIISRDRRADLFRALNSLKEVDYPREKVEVIVVEETDDPLDTSLEAQGVRYLPLPRGHAGYGYSRNVALHQATHEVVAFTDDDCVVEKGWLKELVSPLSREKDYVGVAGGVLTRGSRLVGLCENVLGFPGGGLRYIHEARGEVRETRYLSTCNCAYFTDVVKEAGGFDARAGQGGEDYLLAHTITQRHHCLFNPHAVVYHRPRGSLIQVFLWFVRRGKSDIHLLHLHEERRKYRWTMIKSSLGLKIFACLLLWVVMRGSLFSLGLVAFLYYAVQVYRYRFSYRYLRSWRVLFLTPVVKLFMDLGMDVGRIVALLDRTRTR